MVVAWSTFDLSLSLHSFFVYNLKQAHPGMKRNLKFDDEVMDLVLDVKMEGEDTWKKIRPGRTMEVKRTLPARSDAPELDPGEISSMLSGGSSSGGHATGANATPQGSS